MTGETDALTDGHKMSKHKEVKHNHATNECKNRLKIKTTKITSLTMDGRMPLTTLMMLSVPMSRDSCSKVILFCNP